MTGGLLQAGRDAYARRAWTRADELLRGAAAQAPLPPPDLERSAVAAYMLGADERRIELLGQAHEGHLRAGDRLGAVRTAFWLVVHLALSGEIGRATGWRNRAHRIVASGEGDSLERGYLASADSLHSMVAGDWAATRARATDAVGAGERFGDPDLVALGLIDLGRAMIEEGDATGGLEALDEAMLAAAADQLSPVATGFVYCSVIEGCHLTYEVARAGEWTRALAEWCDAQPDLVPFTGTCLIHRAEILQLRGALGEALVHARLARDRMAGRRAARAAGDACYRCGEILRIRGDLAGAEREFEDARGFGREPQPGLALIRLAQGRLDAACAAIRGALASARPVDRGRFLPAQAEIALAAGDRDGALAACEELEDLARRNGRTMLSACAAYARGAVDLAEGDARAAVAPLRRAARLWLDLDAPYEAARARVLIARACRSAGDDETADLELRAARDGLTAIGADPDIACRGPVPAGPLVPDHGLTPREVQVLRRLATGESNKTIAAGLGVSRRTVDRHVSNLYGKLRVSSRAAATAWAYENDLV